MPDDYEALVAQRDAIITRQNERIVANILREVAELPDRTSPENAPDMMLVSADELRAIVLAALKQS